MLVALRKGLVYTIAGSFNSTRKLTRVPADCVSYEARLTPRARAGPYRPRCLQIRVEWPPRRRAGRPRWRFESPEVEGLGWRKATSAVGELLVEKNTKGMDVVYAISGHL